jgi:ABC-type sulfate transport system permease component
MRTTATLRRTATPAPDPTASIDVGLVVGVVAAVAAVLACCLTAWIFGVKPRGSNNDNKDEPR